MLVKCLWFLVFLGVLCSCQDRTLTTPVFQLKNKENSPIGLVTFYQCNRCHELGADVPSLGLMQDCKGCHLKIRNESTFGSYKKEDVERWKKRIQHFYLIPSLENIDLRIKREWFEKFLVDPHIVRPGLGSMMPKLDISEIEAKTIANYFYRDNGLSKISEELIKGVKEKGRKTFHDKQCNICHENGLSDLSQIAYPLTGNISDTLKMAPDLSRTKYRMSRSNVVLWLSTPSLINPNSLMPRIELTSSEIEDLTAYIFSLPDEELDCDVNIELEQDMNRMISYSEIETKIFKNTCWHCHSNPVPMRGDGGPGNTGGFGFQGQGVDFSTYESFMKGGLGTDGKRVSLIADNEHKVPKVISHLISRHYEIKCNRYSGPRGMPLGLPAVEVENINLFYNWIRQGAKP